MAITIGGKMLVEAIKQEEVEYVFGLPGSTDLLFLDALEDYPEIKYILGLHEVVALGMAEGYAKVSGKIGVVNLHGVPGLAAASPVLFNAHLVGAPLVVMAGYPDARMFKKGAPGLCNQSDLAHLFTKWSVEIRRITDIPTQIHQAFKIALQPPAGPVFVSLPKDMKDDSRNVESPPATPLSAPVELDGYEATGKAPEKEKPGKFSSEKGNYLRGQATLAVSGLLHQIKDQIMPEAITVLLQELKKQIKPGAIIIEESPSYAADIQRFLDSKEPLSYFHGLAGGSIGYGLPNALGARIAAPERPVIAIIGDGGAVWSIQSLWTAEHYHLPVTFIVMVNSSYRVLKLIKKALLGKDSKGRSLGLDFSEPRLNFCQMAQSMGVAGSKVERLDEIGESLKLALQGNAPYLLEVDLKDDV
jgi:thiamine pyrophosphate-dependent acetolactate synthase large subunit-like protein